MADLYGVIFLLQFLVVVGVFLVKLHNLMSGGRIYDVRAGFLLFIGVLLAYGVGFIVSILGFSENLYHLLMILESMLLVFHFALMFFELLFFMGVLSDNVIKPYNSREARYGRSRGR